MAAGESVKVVSERLGHTNAAMTLNVYSRLFPESVPRMCPLSRRAEGPRRSERCLGGTVRLRVEFTTEPFDLDEAPAHALVAREVIEGAELDAVDVGPFGNTAEGRADVVLTALDALLRRTLEAGATRISLQVNVIDGEGGR
ncbi:uncharacterized protein YqgV (UPF0045/DUF77 family) [Streptomyces turgidiscabies]|uniref:Uncharacterized protein YqgV (UPF0045/DUF77 family) n=1 Tax=Streptomyces turgidiscabies TaxID=85558 RepID=A0ABU0RZ49_9ACTN|nr:uncharacterized protein YqgV (UPF0045/DUF77 family) [Streptomyces turgidiscabies]